MAQRLRRGALAPAALQREDRGLGAVTDVELFKDAVEVGLDGRLVDEELLGDLFVAQAAHDEDQHIHFALRELLRSRRRRLLSLALLERGELLHHAPGDRGRETRLAAVDLLDRR